MHKVVLGANLGFLPFIIIYTVIEHRWAFGTALVLWGLTTWILMSEWWSLDETLQKYTFDSTLMVALHVIYLGGLVFLPVSSLIYIDKDSGLVYYAGALIALSVLDIPISLFYGTITKGQREEKSFKANAIFDGFLLVFYLAFLFVFTPVLAPLTPLVSVSLMTKALILSACYLIEFCLDHFVVPHLAK